MIAPAGYSGTIQSRNGGTYQVDGDGFVTGVAQVDVIDLLRAGFIMAGAADKAEASLGKLIGANMNVTTDQAIPLSAFGLDPASTKVYVSRIVITNASISLTTAAGGFYLGTGKAGGTIVAAGQVYTALTTAAAALEATIAARLTQTVPALYLSLTTPQGAAATADVYVFGTVLG
jgi:hypothetical protein